MTVATVYIDESATLDQVRGAVEEWQECTPTARGVRLHYDLDGDG